MTLVAVPINPWRLNDRTAATLLDGLLTMPNLFPLPGTVEERRTLIASILSDPVNKGWMVWSGGTFCGVWLLTHIVPKIDAQCHLAFFDRQLYGRRNMIWNLMGKSFYELDLQRLSVEIPEHLTPLIKYVKQKLSFRFEGEDRAAAHPLIEQHIKPYVANPGSWAASLGSRREASFYRSDTDSWVDVVRLRILRAEYATLGGADARPTRVPPATEPEPE